VVIRDYRDIESESDRSDCEGMPPFEDCTNKEVAYPVKGEDMVIRHTL
jgi:hypothetical protein